MQEEGVIKFSLDYTASAPVDPVPFAELFRWCGVLREAGLIGQDPSRYGGYAFGNVSQRMHKAAGVTGGDAFLVSGIEPVSLRAIDVQHANQRAVYRQRHDDFRTGCRVAGDVPVEFVNVSYSLRFKRRRGCTAHSLANRNTHAGRLALEGAKHQLFPSQDIQSEPIHPIHVVMH